METFTLRQGEEFIELNNLLKILNWAGSGGEAKALIDEGLVQVNDEVENRKRRKVKDGDLVAFEGHQVKVSA